MIGAALVRLRERRKLSVRAAAVVARVGPSTLHAWERGRAMPPADKFLHTLSCLSSSPEEFDEAITLARHAAPTEGAETRTSPAHIPEATP
jgi:transcriptional regulator with XRE-family HTH domain